MRGMRENVGNVEQRLDVTGLDGQRLAKARQRLLGVAKRHHGDATIEMGVGIVRPQRNEFVDPWHRVATASDADERGGQIRDQLRRVWPLLQRGLDQRNRGRRLALLQSKHAQKVERVEIGGMCIQIDA